jgi:hypothetical protein
MTKYLATSDNRECMLAGMRITLRIAEQGSLRDTAVLRFEASLREAPQDEAFFLMP